MLPSHPLRLESVPTVGVIVLIITCAPKPDKKTCNTFFFLPKKKRHFCVFAAYFDFNGQHYSEKAIVFAHITHILISVSLETPCLCCGFFLSGTADSHGS